jgi:hypothetical protein
MAGEDRCAPIVHVNRICVLSMRKPNVKLHCVFRLQPGVLDALLFSLPLEPDRSADPFNGWDFEEELGSQEAYAQLT